MGGAAGRDASSLPTGTAISHEEMESHGNPNAHSINLPSLSGKCRVVRAGADVYSHTCGIKKKVTYIG